METVDFLNDAFVNNVRDDAELLAHTDAKFPKTESARLSAVLAAYYRKELPFGLDAYKNLPDQSIENRMAIQKDEFWTAVGRFTPVLDFSEQERLKFARESDCDKLIVFLLYERDLDVLDAVFNNPRLPTKVLLDYINLIKERDLDREDDKILKLAQQIMKRRSRRIIKARQIHAASGDTLNDDQALTLFSYLGDEDPLIVQAASNAISSMTVVELKGYLNDASFSSRLRARMPLMSGIQFFNSLKMAIRVILAEKAHRELLDPEKDKQVFDDLNDDLQGCKLRELEHCADDPVDFYNLTVVVMMHLDDDQAVSERAESILALDDIFELVGDESTARSTSREIIRLLEHHPDKIVQTKAQELRLRETERLNKKMKEIEVSVNAYFDVIFQSLNYARINTNKDAVGNLRAAIQYLQQYTAEAPDQIEQGHSAVSQGFIRKAITYFESSINELYGDTKKEVFTELDQIQGMVQHILDLKNFKFDEENAREEDVDKEVLEKAVMIWRVAISQFLGRVKDLEEMLRLKWGKLMREKDKSKKAEEIESDLYEAFDEIEVHHKESVECKLKIPCRECKRRGCASERFLQQVDFLLDEVSRNFGKSPGLSG